MSTINARSTTSNDGYTQSVVWKAFEFTERERFDRLRRKVARPDSVAKNSPFFPQTYKEYIDHRANILADQIKAQKRAIALKEEHSKARRKMKGEWETKAEVMPALGGRELAWCMAPLPHKGVWASAQHLNEYEDEEFCARVEGLLGEDLLKEI